MTIAEYLDRRHRRIYAKKELEHWRKENNITATAYARTENEGLIKESIMERGKISYYEQKLNDLL